MKKVKYFIFILICLFSCSIVFADNEVIIKSITPEYNQHSTMIVNEQNVTFNDKDQEINYVVILENISNKEIKIKNIELSKPSNNFIEYSYKINGTKDYLKSNETKELILSLKTSDSENFETDYIDELSATLSFEESVKNPNTSTNIKIIILTVSLLGTIIIILLSKKTKIVEYSLVLFIIVTSISIVHALNINSIDIKIKVSYDSTFTRNLFDPQASENGGLYHCDSGSWLELAAYSSTGYIPIEPNVYYYVSSAKTEQTHISFYDENYKFLGGTRPGLYGNEIPIITSNNDVKYMRIGYKTNQEDSLLISKKSYVQEDINSIREKLKLTISENNDGTQWANKKWAAFGTSITRTAGGYGKYVPYLVNSSQLTVSNYGVDGGTIHNHILTQISAANYKDVNIVTIEGSVNDYASNIPLGTVGDTTPNTFAGALYRSIKLASQNSNDAAVVVITDTVGRFNPKTGANYSANVKNNLGLTQEDYINMMISVSEYMGVTCINTGAHIELSDSFYVDHIHQSELGGEIYANAIWEKLKMINLKEK